MCVSKRWTWFLGHHVSPQAIQHRLPKVNAVTDFPQPTTRKQVESLLAQGVLSQILRPTALCRINFTVGKLLENHRFEWSDLISMLASRPILRLPDYDKPVCLVVNASQVAVLLLISGFEHPVCYLNRKSTSSTTQQSRNKRWCWWTWFGRAVFILAHLRLSYKLTTAQCSS